MADSFPQSRSCLSCPFCGGEAEFHQRSVTHGHGDFGLDHFVGCVSCGARGPSFDQYRSSEREAQNNAMSEWNRRAPRSETGSRKEDRLERGRIDHEWHAAINRFTDGKIGTKDWPHFMYEGKSLSGEVPRMTYVLRLEREGKLPKIHQQCSHSEVEKVEDNHLSCCLGVECRKCPHLLALEKAEIPVEKLDEAKAWTCAAHILMAGDGVDRSEGYLLTTSDRMYWQNVYASLAQEEPK